MTKNATRTFIRELGGPTRVALLLSEATPVKVTRPLVAMWCTVDNIPHKWRPAVAALSQKLKLRTSHVPLEIRYYLQFSRKAA